MSLTERHIFPLTLVKQKDNFREFPPLSLIGDNPNSMKEKAGSPSKSLQKEDFFHCLCGNFQFNLLVGNSWDCSERA